MASSIQHQVHTATVALRLSVAASAEAGMLTDARAQCFCREIVYKEGFVARAQGPYGDDVFGVTIEDLYPIELAQLAEFVLRF